MFAFTKGAITSVSTTEARKRFNAQMATEVSALSSEPLG